MDREADGRKIESLIGVIAVGGYLERVRALKNDRIADESLLEAAFGTEPIDVFDAFRIPAIESGFGEVAMRIRGMLAGPVVAGRLMPEP